MIGSVFLKFLVVVCYTHPAAACLWCLLHLPVHIDDKLVALLIQTKLQSWQPFPAPLS